MLLVSVTSVCHLPDDRHTFTLVWVLIWDRQVVPSVKLEAIPIGRVRLSRCCRDSRACWRGGDEREKETPL